MGKGSRRDHPCLSVRQPYLHRQTNPASECKSPLTLNGSAVTLYLYVEGVDAFFNRAVAAGAKAVMPVQDMFWGDRSGTLEDPFGHRWSVATHIEDLTPEETTRRAVEFFSSKA